MIEMVASKLSVHNYLEQLDCLKTSKQCHHNKYCYRKLDSKSKVKDIIYILYFLKKCVYFIDRTRIIWLTLDIIAVVVSFMS